MKMDWIKSNQAIAVAIILCVTGLLALAMWLGLDLSWVPGLLGKLIGG